MAVLPGEPEGGARAAVAGTDAKLLVPAATMAEASGRDGQARDRDQDGRFVDTVEVGVPGMTARVAGAYASRGEGNHPAGLNLGRSVACALAKAVSRSLLRVGRGTSSGRS